MKHVLILGAGISGLAAGWFLKQKYPSLSLTILEKSSRCGGWIQTIQNDGFMFELGPRSCRPSQLTFQLIKDLNLDQEVLLAHSQAKLRYLYRNQSLQQVPGNLLDFLKSPLLPMVLRGAARDLFARRSKEEDESIESFVTRRLGSHIAHEVFDPLTSGIYAGDISRLSMKACFPQIAGWEADKGSLIKGAFSTKRQQGTIFSFKKGMQTLTDALEANLKRHIWLDTSVHKLPFDKADHIISALPAQALGALLAKEDTEIAQHLISMENQSVTVVNLGFRKKVLTKEGFGYLIPTREKEEILGVVFDSSVFPDQGEGTRLTVMIKGQVDNPIDVALRSLHKHLQISCLPDAYYVHRAQQAIPQYYMGHNSKVSKIEELIAKRGMPLSLLGSGFKGVSVNDCIANACRLASSLM